MEMETSIYFKFILRHLVNAVLNSNYYYVIMVKLNVTRWQYTDILKCQFQNQKFSVCDKKKQIYSCHFFINLEKIPCVLFNTQFKNNE